MGEVWPCTHRTTRDLRACKSIPKQNTTQEQFRNEISMLRTLKHGNIVGFIEAFEESNRYHIILECCLDTLEDALEGTTEGLRQPEMLRTWAIDMVSSLSYLHSLGICHRDVKPANFLIGYKERCLKLGDFGLARRQTSGFTEVVGTPAFISCEMHRILMGHPGVEYGLPCDMWAVGIIVFIMFTNYHPFCETPPRSMLKTLHSVAEFKFEPLQLMGKLNMQQLLNCEVKWPYALKGVHIPPTAKAFVESCLLPMPDQRLTAREAMNNEWFGGHLGRKMEPEKRLVPFGIDAWSQYEFIPHGNKLVDPIEADWPADPREGCLTQCMYNMDKKRRRRSQEETRYPRESYPSIYDPVRQQSIQHLKNPHTTGTQMPMPQYTQTSIPEYY